MQAEEEQLRAAQTIAAQKQRERQQEQSEDNSIRRQLEALLSLSTMVDARPVAKMPARDAAPAPAAVTPSASKAQYNTSDFIQHIIAAALAAASSTDASPNGVKVRSYIPSFLACIS